MKEYQRQIVTISKLVHGGQGLAELDSGKKLFVWGSLPGEIVEVLVTKSRKDYLEGFVTNVVEHSTDRISPQEPEVYLSTSPWQVINYLKEAQYKQAILEETFQREGLNIAWQDFYQDDHQYGYRNKMEYNFWFDTEANQVSLALHRRGSHQKVAVEGSLLANNDINRAGKALIKYINKNKIEARPLKSVILRSDQSGQVGICLFVNNKEITLKFANFKYPNSIFEIVYSNPKSPASVTTEVLKENKRVLNDKLLDKGFRYSTRSFFQVNLPVYEQALLKIKNHLSSMPTKTVIDLYSGVGSIGLNVAGQSQKLIMIETDAESAKVAQQNITSPKNQKIITASAEDSLVYITGSEIVIVDPPRAGLHSKVTNRLLKILPKDIIYLSCNPSTQARDVKELIGSGYKVVSAQGFNFFPRTPHIESLIILQL